MDEVAVFMHLPGRVDAVPAGLVARDAARRVGTFAYGRRYLARDDALPVDIVGCPLGERIAATTLNEGLYGAFRDASPDWWGRLVVGRRLGRDPGTLDPLELLLHGGASRVGALDFRTSIDASPAQDHLPTLADLADVVDTATAIRENRPVASALVDLLQQGTSLGGMRPKCVVRDGTSLWIAKFPATGDTFDQPRVEHATMRLAARAGIEVADTRLHVLPDQRAVLLVRRFDRVVRDDGAAARIAFVSALTVLRSDDQDRSNWHYPQLAASLRELAISRQDLRELYRRMVFNAAVRNTDDHPRNHGVLYDARRCWLSPAYDLVPQPAVPGVATDFHLAMGIGDQGRIATVENLLSRSPQFGVARDEAIAIARDVGTRVQSWRECFADAGLDAAAQAPFRASFALADRLAAA